MKTQKIRIRILALVMLCMLGALSVGCVNVERQLMQQGASSSYAAGYAHGRATGQAWGGMTKDIRRYNNDAEYKQGWDEGYQLAKNQKDTLVNLMR